MRRNRKRSVVLLWILAAALVLAGCSGGGGSGGGEGAPGGENGGGMSGERPSGSEGETEAVSLRIWIQSVNQPEFFQWVKQEFEASNKDIKLKVEAQAANALGDALDVTLGGSNAPDIAATWGGLVAPKLYRGKRILPLDDVITPEVEANLLDAAAYNKLDGDGVFVSLPLAGFASPVIFYNKTQFDKLGLGIPTTYDELKAVAQSVRAAGKQPLIAGFSTWPLPHFMQAIHARTMPAEEFGALIGRPKDKNPYDAAGFAEGFRLLKRYQDDGIFADNITGYDANMAHMEFIAQNALMLAAPSLDLLTLNQSTSFEIGAFVLPPGASDGPLVSGVYSDVLVVGANTKYPEQAKRLLRFLLSPEAQAKLLEFDLLPVLKDVDISQANPALSEVVAAIKAKGVSGFYQNYSTTGIDLQLLTAGGGVLTGSMSPEDAAKLVADYYQSSELR